MGLLDATRCAGRILSSFYERFALVLSILVAYLRHQEEGLHRKVVQIYLSPAKRSVEIDLLLPECLDLRVDWNEPSRNEIRYLLYLFD